MWNNWRGGELCVKILIKLLTIKVLKSEIRYVLNKYSHWKALFTPTGGLDSF